jgi:hypothetical protein
MNRIKLHVISSTQPATLMRVVRFLVARQIPIECGNQFVKFPRGEAPADAAAERLKELGFRPLPSTDALEVETDANLADRVAASLAAERAEQAANCCDDPNHNHGHDHDHSHDHDHKHDHDHSHDHDHKHDHKHGH